MVWNFAKHISSQRIFENARPTVWQPCGIDNTNTLPNTTGSFVLNIKISNHSPLDKNNSIFKHHITSVITQFLYWLFWPFHIWFCRCYWGFFNAIRLFCIMALGLACTYWPIPFSQNGNILCRSYYYYCVHLWPAPKRNILQFSDLV